MKHHLAQARDQSDSGRRRKLRRRELRSGLHDARGHRSETAPTGVRAGLQATHARTAARTVVAPTKRGRRFGSVSRSVSSIGRDIQPLRPQADKPVVANDHVVQDLDSKQEPGLAGVVCEPHVVGRGTWITRRMVVDQDDRRGSAPDSLAEAIGKADGHLGLAALVDQRGVDETAAPIEQDNTELLLRQIGHFGAEVGRDVRRRAEPMAMPYGGGARLDMESLLLRGVSPGTPTW